MIRTRAAAYFSRIVGDRRFPFAIGGAAFLFSLLFLSLGWLFDDSYLRLQMMNTGDVRAYVPGEHAFDPARGLYVLLDPDHGRTSFLKDRGLVPWWADPRAKVAFWRPLTSLDIFLDHALFGDEPLLFHLRNSLWFALLAFLTAHLYRRIHDEALDSGLASILFVFNATVLMPVAWIANRHTLIAMSFGIASLLCLDRFVKGGGRRSVRIILSCACFIFSLLASELGIITCAYAAAYLLVFAEGEWKKRLGTFVPFFVIVVVWRIVYTALGFGVAGIEIYVDPVASPIEYLASLPLRLPFVLAGACIGFPADVSSYLSIESLPVVAFLLALVMAGALALIARAVRRDRLLRFWLVSLAFALPLLCTSGPADRHLVFLMLGASAGLARLRTMSAARADERVRPLRATGRVIIVSIIVIRIAGGLVGAAMLGQSTQATRRMSAEFLDFGNDPGASGSELVIVRPPIVHFVFSLSVDRLVEGLPIPERIRVLAPAFSPFTLTRLDDHRIRIETEYGFYPPPSPSLVRSHSADALFVSPLPHIDPLFHLARLERMFVGPRTRFRVGETIKLPDLTVEVTALTDDGRIRDVVFAFVTPLDEPPLRFVTWNDTTRSYEPFVFPEAGESIHLNRSDI